MILKLIFKKFGRDWTMGFSSKKNLIFFKNLAGTGERGGKTMGFMVNNKHKINN